MKSKIFLLGVAAFIFSACSNEIDSPLSIDGAKIPLKINVVSTPTKTQVSGTLLPRNSELGVFIKTEDTGDFQSTHPYNNIKYTGSGTTYADTWAVDPSTPIYLNDKACTAYAYYPRQASGAGLHGIQITNDGTDWMYADPVENLNMNNSTANFQLKHIMSIIRISILPGNNIGLNPVSKVTIDGTGIASGATLNLATGTLGNYTGVGKQIVKNDVGTLGSIPALDFWVVPKGVVSDIVFNATINGKVYQSMSSRIKLSAGKIHTFKLIVDNKGMELESININDWIDNSETNIQSSVSSFADVMRSKFQNITTDGVYAVKADGTPVAYASATDQSYAAVAFIVNGKAYQVSKMKPADNQGRHWDNTYRDNIGLTNYTTVDGTDSRKTGYLSGTNEPQLTKDPSEWREGALSDFNGKNNTQKIIAAQTSNGILLHETFGKVVMNFRENETVNEGLTDWFVPACGEWAYMMLKKNEINDLLNRASGEEFIVSEHWTSSIYNDASAWYIDVSEDLIGTHTKIHYGIWFRLIREI